MAAAVWAIGGAVALVLLGDLRAAPVLSVSTLLVWAAGVLALPRPRLSSENTVRTVFLVALLVRVVLLASPPTLSDDLFRYVWEGTLTAHGGNPFLTAPADEALSAWALDPHRVRVNHPHIPTIYPPLALWLFAATSSVWPHVLTFKLVAGVADAATAGLLAAILRHRRRSADGAWLYALLPLGAVESAGSGHLDPIAVCCLAAAIYAWDRRRTGLGFAGLGALLKLFPVVVFIPLLRHPRRVWPAAVGLLALAVLSAWPFAEAGPAVLEGLTTYARHWSFNGSVYPVAHAILGQWARPVLVGVGALVVGIASLRRQDPAEVALWAGAAFVLLSPTVHPWYVAWAWVPALIVGVPAFTLLAALMPLAYVVLATADPITGAWQEAVWPRLVIYGLFFSKLAADAAADLTTPGPPR